MIHCICNNFNESSVHAGIIELKNYLGEAFANEQPGYLAKIVDRACREARSAIDVYEQDHVQKENRPGCGTCLKPLADIVQAYQNGGGIDQRESHHARGTTRYVAPPAPENRL
jgi:hypothetical protein